MRNTVVAICIVILIVGFVAGFTIARARYRPLLLSNSSDIMVRDAQIKKLQDENKQNEMKVASTGTSYVMKNGQMIIEENGKESPMAADVTLANGTKIMKDGTIVAKSGGKMKLSNGEKFSFAQTLGNLTK